jgi:hypothetical protein
LLAFPILFFGYDASVMSQVNADQNYLDLMGLPDAITGSSTQPAAVKGLVSVWFAGFVVDALLVEYYAGDWETEDDRAWMHMR